MRRKPRRTPSKPNAKNPRCAAEFVYGPYSPLGRPNRSTVPYEYECEFARPDWEQILSEYLNGKGQNRYVFLCANHAVSSGVWW